MTEAEGLTVLATGNRQQATEDSPTDDRFTALRDALTIDVRVLSLDVFDTLVMRRVAKPTDAHLLLGRKLADAGALKAHLDPRTFARLRILAEQEARNRKLTTHGTPEVTLAEIWAILAPAITDQLQVADLVDREVAHERAVTFPDRRLLRVLREELESRSASPDRPLLVVAVSDTYLSEVQLRSLLGEHGVDELEFSKIYTSSDCGTGKGGSLWDHVVADLGMEPFEILHAGDNPEADVEAATRSGIRAVHIPLCSPHFEWIEIRERIVGDPGDPSPWCDDRTGDGGLTSVRRRASLLRVPDSPGAEDSGPGQRQPGEEAVTWETGTAVLGPVFTGYAQWVHERAADLGASKALCVMREGRFLQRLLQGVDAGAALGLKAETLWASREACARASVYEGTDDELRSFLDRLKDPTPRHLLGSLGIDELEDPEIEAIVSKLEGSGTDDRAAGQTLMDLVLSRGDLVRAVVERSRRRRRGLVSHLRAQAGPGGGPVVLVDIGWAGTILESLGRMLEAEGQELSLHGLYLLAHVGSAGPLLRGCALEGYLGDAGAIPFDLAGVTGNPEIVELVCMSDDGSFLEMTDDGTPLLAAAGRLAVQSRRRALVQQGILAFQAEWGADRDPVTSYETSAEGRAAMRRILERFVSQPSRSEVEAFSWWEHEENFGSARVDLLVPSRLVSTASYRTAEQLHTTPAEQLYWVGGAAGSVDDDTADAVLLMRRAHTAPGRFQSAIGIGPASVFLTLADGSEVRAADIPVVVNRRGLSLVEWEGDPGTATRILLRPTEDRAVLRIDRIELTGTDHSGAVVESRTWTSTSSVAGEEGPAVVGATAIAADAYQVDERTRIVLPLPTGTSTIVFTLAGAYLPIPEPTAEHPRFGQRVRAKLRSLVT